MELLRLVGFFSKRFILSDDLETLILCDELRDLIPNLWANATQIDEDGQSSINQQVYREILELLRNNGLLLYSDQETHGQHGLQMYDVQPSPHWETVYASELQQLHEHNQAQQQEGEEPQAKDVIAEMQPRKRGRPRKAH